MSRSASEASAAPVSGPAPFDPVGVNRPPRLNRFPLKVVVLNARSGARLDTIARRLSRPPLAGTGAIMLCEADWHMRRSGGREIAAELAARLDMSFVYVPSFAFSHGNGPTRSFIGNAILCSEPLSHVKLVPLPPPPKPLRRPRRVGVLTGIVASATFEGVPITLGVAHLDRRVDPQFRGLQMSEYLAALPSRGRTIIGGDFNTTTIEIVGLRDIVKASLMLLMDPRRFRDPIPHEPLFDRIRGAGFEVEDANVPNAPSFTFTRLIPRFLRPRLDWIAIRGLNAVPGSAAVLAPRAHALGVRASDHDFVVCEVTI
jgi:endonuclease/exonuclease/phosphatase family metal-dependent hydrolase